VRSTSGRRAVDERSTIGGAYLRGFPGLQDIRANAILATCIRGRLHFASPRHFGSTTVQSFPAYHYLLASCIRHAVVLRNPLVVLATGKVFHRVNDTEDRLVTQIVNECRTSCNQNATGTVGGN